MLVFDQLNIHNRGNATYDPGATLIGANDPSNGSNNTRITRTNLAAGNYLRANSIQWACAPGGPTSSNASGSVWSFSMPTAYDNLLSWLSTNSGTAMTAVYLDTQNNILNPYAVCVSLWGYRGINTSTSLPQITQAAFDKAKGLCRQYWWMMADAFTAAKKCSPTLQIGLYHHPVDSQNYQRIYAQRNEGTSRSDYPNGMKWAKRGQDFMAQFVGSLDFLAPSSYTMYGGNYAGYSAYQRATFQGVTQRDIRWCRQFGKPVIPFVSPSGHGSRANWATTTIDSAVFQDQMDFMQDDMGVFGVILWDTGNTRTSITTTLYNTNGLWTVIDKYAPGGSKYQDVSDKNGTGVLFNNGAWGL